MNNRWIDNIRPIDTQPIIVNRPIDNNELIDQNDNRWIDNRPIAIRVTYTIG